MKVAIILHAEPGTEDSMGRAAHSLIYTKELKDKGHDVKLIFDGGGTAWIRRMIERDHPLNPLYLEAKERGAIEGVCHFCTTAFGDKIENMNAEGLKLLGDFIEHPSVASFVEDGYQIITL